MPGTVNKQSALGGSGNDIPFEQAFGNLAHAYLRERAPGLMDYELGFQLVDRNEDDTKAVGIFVFKVGSHILDAPVFFINGQLKGNEILHLKEQDQIIPLKEGWLNYILNRKPINIGSGVPRTGRGSGRPDIEALSRIPKSGADHKAELAAAIKGYAKIAFADPRQHLNQLGTQLNLVNFLKTADARLRRVFVNTCYAYPRFAEAVERFHGFDVLKQAFKENPPQDSSASYLIKKTVRPKHETISFSPKKCAAEDKVDILTSKDVELNPLDDVDEKSKEQLLRDGFIIRDRRESGEVGTALRTRSKRDIRTPTESGLYDVLLAGGDVDKFAVFLSPLNPAGRSDQAMLVRLSDKKFVIASTGDILVINKYRDEEFESWLADLPAYTGPGEDFSVAIVDKDHATVPLRSRRKYVDSYGETVWHAEMPGKIVCPRNLQLPFPPNSAVPGCSDDPYWANWGDRRIVVDKAPGTKLRSAHGTVFIPKDSKKLDVDDVEASDDWVWNEENSKGRQVPPPIRLGTVDDMMRLLHAKTAALSVYHDGLDFELNGQRVNKTEALFYLVKKANLREGIAREILSEAVAKQRINLRIKAAEFPYDLGGAPEQPPIQYGTDPYLGSSLPTVMPEQYNLPLDQYNTAQNADLPENNPNPMYDQMPGDAAAIAQQAAQTGEREVFDTGAISGLLRTVSEDSMVDKHLKSLMAAIDSIGRLIIQFYWHQDEFGDRYGKQELPELEDALRNTFEQLGDLTLELKEKAIEPSPEGSLLGGLE